MLAEHFHTQKTCPHMALAISGSPPPSLLAAAVNHYDSNHCANQTASHPTCPRTVKTVLPLQWTGARTKDRAGAEAGIRAWERIRPEDEEAAEAE